MCSGLSANLIKCNKSTSVRSKLTCHYRRTLIPYKRWKEEVLNFDPWVAQLHDFMRDEESDFFMQESKKTLVPSVAGRVVDGVKYGTTGYVRVGKVAWFLDNHTDPTVGLISRRIEELTTFDTKWRETGPSGAEPFQTVGYGIGGNLMPHMDHHNASKFERDGMMKNSGNRMVTMLLYLNDVEKGGATVWPKLNVSFFPVKNAAVYWFNYKRSGEVDRRLVHAACPVILGHKWVATKWIREKNQFKSRPCGLHPNSTDTYLYI
ncbi:unnamed protein product [Owenia fusiformis]|uniref:Uncharacterized protein n=1 Tax=Owenia fusiformis TaxID=6347 RepID=A0A8J1U6V2_OWEFU|nr:unnamed protein product [Owenia fusiformis]